MTDRRTPHKIIRDVEKGHEGTTVPPRCAYRITCDVQSNMLMKAGKIGGVGHPPHDCLS